MNKENYSPTFNKNDPKYRCCCNSMHVETGTTILAVLGAVGVVFGIIGAIASIAKAGSSGGIGSLLYWIVYGVIIVLMLRGISTKSAPLLLPYLVLQILSIVTSLIMLLFIIIAGLVFFIIGTVPEFAQSWGNEQGMLVLAFAIVVICVLVLTAINIWLGLVVKKCYGYFRDLAASEENANAYNLYDNRV